MNSGSNLKSYRKTLNKALADHQYFSKLCTEEKANLKQAETRLQDAADAVVVLQQFTVKIQEHAHKEIAGVVTRCLQAVFEDPYEFRVLFEKKRGKTEARLTFFREGQEVDPLTAAGGGVVDVAAFALRLSALMLTQPAPRRFLLLDEPFRFLSPDLRPRAKVIIETLARELKLQILMVTHAHTFQAGKVISL